MSDDGYYYEDEFDDFLWDADPEQDLADDLASHAIHSPNYQDDATFEKVDEVYHSDWEYYSDDFYDDDPAILKNNPQDGSPIRRRDQSDGDGQKRGKKRKLVEVQDNPDLESRERITLKDCMRGTVWAKPLPERDNIFIPGKETKIALLKDWKKRFGSASIQDKASLERPTLPEDESWANDMSLADMGLSLQRGKLTEGQIKKNAAETENEGKGDDNHDEKEHGVELSKEQAEALLLQMEGMDEKETEALLVQLKSQVRGTKHAASLNASLARNPHPLTEVQAGSPPSDDQIDEPLAVLPKRRKHNNEVLPSPPQSNQSPVLEHSDATAPVSVERDGREPDQNPTRGRGRPSKVPKPAAPQREISSSTVTSTRSRKRKASVSPSPERNKDVSRLTTSSRAKRVASTVKGVGAETSEKEHGGTNVSTRSTRSRKKV